MSVKRAARQVIGGEFYRHLYNGAVSGGTITTAGGYRIHTFYSSGTLKVFGPLQSVEYLIVAQGGAGGPGNYRAGGGGAGGLLSASGETLLGADYAVVVGSGSNSTGANSSFNGATAYGGGYDTVQVNGGAGGSGSGTTGATNSSVPTVGGAGIPGQGYDGGRGFNNYGSQTITGGGGGGSASAGTNGSSSSAGGNGGLGTLWNGTTYAKGGDGGDDANPTAQAGAANTGNGASGVKHNTSSSIAYGGSGIVIVRYPL